MAVPNRINFLRTTRKPARETHALAGENHGWHSRGYSETMMFAIAGTRSPTRETPAHGRAGSVLPGGGAIPEVARPQAGVYNSYEITFIRSNVVGT